MKKSVQLRNTHMPNAFGSIGMVFQLIATLGLGRKMMPNFLLNRIWIFMDFQRFHWTTSCDFCDNENLEK